VLFGHEVADAGRGIHRRDFVRLCVILGITLPLIGCDDGGEEADQSDGSSDGSEQTDPSDRSVIVVGAGAAGLTAAHLLTRAGVEVKVLEASPIFGGRIRQLDDFVDFPIPLGAEWLHSDVGTLDRIIDDWAVEIDIETVGYRSDDTLGYYDGELTIEEAGPSTDLKFVGATWFDFFDRFVVPGVADRLQFDTQVVSIDATGDQVVVTDQRGVTVEVDAVIVTVPVTVLRRREISFAPELSADKWAAIDGVDVWGGLKAFFEFDRAFFPTFLEFPDSDTDAGQRLYYDAAYGQDSSTHVLGLFAVGAPAEPYLALEGDAQRDYILAELDEIFGGAASRHYIQHVVQNWTDEPFINQAYVADEADWELVRTLGEPANDRVLFAGDAYTDGEDWSAVHVAANSARVAVERVLADP
jgi:monoamine oxidase